MAVVILISILLLILVYCIFCILCIKIFNNQEKPEYYLLSAFIPIFNLIYVINSRKYLKKEYEKDDYSPTKPNTGKEDDEGEDDRFNGGGRWKGFEEDRNEGRFRMFDENP